MCRFPPEEVALCKRSETFVLIHGSWHAGWAWGAVIGQLAEKGHSGHAPTLAGHGPNATRLELHIGIVSTQSALIFTNTNSGMSFWLATALADR